MKPVAWQPGFEMRFDVADAGALIGRELGQAVGPVACRPVRGARIDEARLRVADERGRFARGGVGQAEERDVGRIEQPRPLAGVLAQLRRGAQHFDIAAAREVLVNAKAGRAFLAVDENARRHAGLSVGDR